MKILIYGINFSPELTGTGKFTGDMSHWLAFEGHDIRVVTAPPYYPSWRIGDGFSSFAYRIEKRDRMKIYRCPLYVPANPSGLKRILHLLSFAVSSAVSMTAQILWKPDLIFLVEPTFFCAPTALLVANRCGAKTWLHVQDFEVDAAFELGILKGKSVRQRVTSAERWLMHRFDRVSSISVRMLDKLKAKGVPDSSAILFPNWVDLDAIRPLTDPSLFRAELDIPSTAVVALYSGNMGGKQGLEILAEAANILRESSDIWFVFAGDGSGRSSLVDSCKLLRNVLFLPLQPLERLNDLLGLADIHLLPQRADAADLVMPSKLTGMLASGRPVIATAHPDTEVGRAVSECGVIVAPERGDLLARAILDLAENRVRRVALGRQARDYAVRKLGKESILASFRNELACLLPERT
ncbi:MAG: glycosyltransferase WbuB [Janthinobacterium lividum]